MSSSPDSWRDMPQEARETLQGVMKAFTKDLGSDIHSIVLYGSLAGKEYVSGRSNINLLLVMNRISGDVLQRAGGIQQKWAKERLVAPLMLTSDELKASFDAFPLEFLEITDHHLILAGSNPFIACELNDRRLFVQCDQEIRGNLLRVRQRYVEGWGRVEAIQALLPISLTALIPCLRGFYRLLGQGSRGSTEAVLKNMPGVLQVEPGPFHEVWMLKRGLSTPGQKEWPRLLERYLASLSELIDRVDALKREDKFA